MELRKVTDILSATQLDFIEKKAYNYARSQAKNLEEVELLFSKYFFQFMQESVLKGLK